MRSLRLLGALALVSLAACGRPPPPSTEPDSGTPPLPTVTCLDGDGDGVPGTGDCAGISPLDCADADPSIHPGADEVCNGLDDDCDGETDEGLPQKAYYRDQDGDGFGGAQQGSGCALPPEGFSLQAGDCDDLSAARSPAAQESCNAVDDDCDGVVDNGLQTNDFHPDSDGDGYGALEGAMVQDCHPTVAGMAPNALDCDDADANVHPGATEYCNKVDDNCDGLLDNGVAYLDYYPDADNDGFGATGGVPENSCVALPGRVANHQDCNDANAAVKPGAAELCDGLDNDCNGLVDDGVAHVDYYADADGDGYGDPASAPQGACLPVPGRVANKQDCDDTNAAVHPGAQESCNGADDNCNGAVDDGVVYADYYADADGDGHGEKGSTPLSACAPVPGRVTSHDDCDDTKSSVKPGAAETCNGVDDDCNGAVDDALPTTNLYLDADGDGHGEKGGVPLAACGPVAGRVASSDDCDDTKATTFPGAVELCDGLDNDCNGAVDNDVKYTDYFPDQDADGYGAAGAQPQSACTPPAGKVANAQDCDDAKAAIHPGAPELCNGVDDNCDSQADEGLAFLGYYPDLDSDGYGAAGSLPQTACAPIPGKAANDTDCDDANTAVHPGAAELCNGADENCNAQVDEGLPTQDYYVDLDGDGYGGSGTVAITSCKAVTGRVANAQDCDDSKSAVKPGAPELCNATDDNCNGTPDEGNPGGGAACDTGQFGACAAGTVTCQLGALACVRNAPPAAESCDGVDNDCNGQVDETFTDKGTACTAGLGVCQRSGTKVCAPGGQGTTCGAVPGPTTPAACDGLDNDCDGVVDEPGFVSTADIQSTAWTDLEVAPYYFKSTANSGCNGGLVNTTGGSDTLTGGWLVMAGGTYGISVQKLDGAGAPTGAPSMLSYLTYSDVAAAQSGDGVIVAGVWNDQELDIYYVDGSTGVERTYLYSQFKRASSSNKLDSLRMVRGMSGRVTLLWRESNVGIKTAQLKPAYDAATSTWSFQTPTGGTSLSSALLVANSAVMAGLGADSNFPDNSATAACSSATSLRTLGVSYVAPISGNTTSHSVRHFTVKEDGTGKSTETEVDTQLTADGTLREPDELFYRQSGSTTDQWFISYTMGDSSFTPAVTDLLFYMTSAPGYNYAYVAYATDNGASSIQRPRASFSGTEFWVTGLRYVADPSGLKRQVMTRRVDLSGAKLPASSNTELSATVGACPAGDADCRPGNKAGLVSWALKGKVYYSGSGATPAGTYSGTLSCQ